MSLNVSKEEFPVAKFDDEGQLMDVFARRGLGAQATYDELKRLVEANRVVIVKVSGSPTRALVTRKTAGIAENETDLTLLPLE